MGVLLSPSSGTPPWLDIILVLLLTIVMWVALRPFRRLTQMVSSRTNHFATASGGVSTTARSAARTSSKILSTALGTFLGVSGAARGGLNTAGVEAKAASGVPQRIEADSSYQPQVTQPQVTAPIPVVASAPAHSGAGSSSGAPAMAPAAGPAMAPAGVVQPAALASGASGSGAFAEADSAGASHSAAPVPPGDNSLLGGGAGQSLRTGEKRTAGRYEFSTNNPSFVPRDPNREYSGPILPAGTGPEWTPATDGEPTRRPTDRGFPRPESAVVDDFDLDELNEVFRPDPARQR
jgi:hypothetical protein